MQNFLTVIIPCKNEEKYIYNTLCSLSKQHSFYTTRIIIADANSTDNTIAEIKQAQLDFNLNIDIISGGYVSFGRNAGAKLATTPWIVFIDADTTLVEPNILMKCLNKCFEGKTLVTCKVKSISSTYASKLVWIIFNKVQKLLYKPFCVGAFFFTNKDRFDELGGFDETIHQSEDYLLSSKYNRKEFYITNNHITQDDRRFKKMGYIPFLLLVLKNYMNKNNKDHFKKNVNYW